MVSKSFLPQSFCPLTKDVDSCPVAVFCPKEDSVSAIVGYIWALQIMGISVLYV